MNKRQRIAIEQVIERLKGSNCGASLRALGPDSGSVNAALDLLSAHGYEVTSRLYLSTWVIPALELALSPSASEQKLAVQLSEK